jgi:hypothetical protein
MGALVGDLVQELLDAVLMTDAGVKLELNLRRGASEDAAVWRRMNPAARSRGTLCSLRAAASQAGVIHPGVLQVQAHYAVMVTRRGRAGRATWSRLPRDLIRHPFGSRTLAI